MKKYLLPIGWALLIAGVLFSTIGPQVQAQPAKPLLTSIEFSPQAAAITPSDVVTFTSYCRSVYIGGTGNLTVDVANGGTNLAFNGVTAGNTLPVRVKRVYATGTTATGLICLY